MEFSLLLAQCSEGVYIELGLEHVTASILKLLENCRDLSELQVYFSPIFWMGILMEYLVIPRITSYEPEGVHTLLMGLWLTGKEKLVCYWERKGHFRIAMFKY